MNRITNITLALLLSGIFSANASLASDAPSLDVRKSRIESPVKSFLFAPHTKPSLKEIPLSTTGKNSNKVKPGLVNWHSSIQDARKAAKISKKPVFVFHMMGNLDDRFC